MIGRDFGESRSFAAPHPSSLSDARRCLAPGFYGRHAGKKVIRQIRELALESFDRGWGIKLKASW
jgi:hypothetical protein